MVRAFGFGIGLPLGAWLLAACGDDATTDDAGTTGTTADGSAETTVASSVPTTTGVDATSSSADGSSTGSPPADSSGTDSTTGEAFAIDEPIRIVFVADDALRDIDELWLLDESDYEAGPIRLNHELVGPRIISPVTPVTPDGSWLAYRAVRLAPGAEHELWVVDVSSAVPGDPIRVDETAELVFDYGFVADGSHLAWMTATGVFSATMGAGGPGPVVSLAPAVTGAGTYHLFELSRLDDTIFYTADPDDSGARNLYRVPADGSEAAQQLSDLVATGQVDGNGIFPDPAGEYVVYMADRDVAEPELFWVDLVAVGPPIKINDPLTTEAMRTERLSPTGEHIAYWVGTIGAPDVGEVFVAPLDGGGPGVPVGVHGAEVGQPQVGRIIWSADGAWLGYTVDEAGKLRSWVVDLSAGAPSAPVRASGTAAIDGDDLITHVFAPDGSALAYVANTPDGPSAFLVDLSAGVGPIQPVLDPPPFGSGLTGDLRFSPDATQLLFSGYVLSMETRDVYRADISGVPPWPLQQVSPHILPNMEAGVNPVFAGGGSHVLTVGPVDEAGGRRLWDTPPGGVGFDTAVPISGDGYVIAYGDLPPAR